MRAPIYRAACTMLALCCSIGAQNFRPDIPKAWDDAEVARFETPLAQRDRSPRYLSAKEYYALKVRPIYRSYPMYAPGREPAGYIESLKQKDPELFLILPSSRPKTIGSRPAGWCSNRKYFSGRRPRRRR